MKLSSGLGDYFGTIGSKIEHKARRFNVTLPRRFPPLRTEPMSGLFIPSGGRIFV